MPAQYAASFNVGSIWKSRWFASPAALRRRLMAVFQRRTAMKLPGYQLLQMAADAGHLSTAPRVAREQAYPTRSVRMISLPDMKRRLTALGVEAVVDTPEEFAARIRTDITKWTKVIRAAGIKAD
jgi:hypothetical protein